MASDPDAMDWQHDTPPQVLFQSTAPFARSSHRRNHQDFAENRLLETGRSGIPSTSPYDSGAPQIKSPIKPYSNLLQISTQANASSLSPYRNITSSESQHSNQEWFASREKCYGEYAKVWRYLCQSLDTIGHGLAIILSSSTLRTYCFTGYKAGRYYFTKKPRVVQKCQVVAHTANGTKRRRVEHTRHYGPQTPSDRILLSPDQRRLLRYRQLVRDCRTRHDETHIYVPSEATRGAVADPLGYYMSGALQPIESPTEIARVPGAWVQSPIYEAQASCSLAYYNPNSPDLLNSSLISATTDDPTVTNIQLNDPCVAHGTLDSTEDLNSVTDSTSPDAFASKSTDPATAECLTSEGEVDQTLLDIQRCHARYRKQQRNPFLVVRPSSLRRVDRFSPYHRPTSRRRMHQRSSLTSILQPQPSSNDVDLSSPPISFTPPHAPEARPLKKRVTFYSDPMTGQPVSRFRQYVPGSRIDDSFHSSPSDSGLSIHDRSSSSNSDGSAGGQLYSSPTMQEQVQPASSMQGVEPSRPSVRTSGSSTHTGGSEHKKPAISSPMSDSSAQVQAAVALGPTQESAPVTPDNSVLAARRKTTPSPSDQIVEAPSPVTFDPPPLLKPSVAAAKQIVDGRVRRPETTTFAVTADGSPMRIPSSSNPSSTAGSQMLQDNGCLLKENGTPIENRALSEPGDPSLQDGQDDVSQQSSSQSPYVAAETADVNGLTFSKNGSSPEPIGSSVLHEQDSSLLSEISTPSFVVSSPATGAPAHGDSSSSTGEDSNSASVGSSQAKGEGSHLLPDQVDSSVQSQHASSPAAGILAHGASSPPLNESNTPIPTYSSPQQSSSAQPPSQDAGSINPATPDLVTKRLSTLKLSSRKQSLRSAAKVESDDRLRAKKEARLAAEKERKEKEEAEEKARKAELRKKSGARRMPIGPVITPLPAEWDTKVTQALAEQMGKTVASSLVGVNITRRDIGKVLPQRGTSDDAAGWLNDEIVTAYLQIVVEHGLKASGHKRGETPTMHAFNTFFYKNLSEKGPQSVLRWAKKAKIGDEALLNVERVFIPVHMHSNHWTLLVVSPKFRTIEYFDSLNGASAKQIANAKAWLKQELKALYKEDEWKTVGRAGPTQNNGADCGVFVSTTAKMIMLGVEPTAYNCKDIPTQRRRIVAELMNSGFGGGLAPEVVFKED